jgi:dTDP-4-dehydrorhamnose reductase
VRILIIGGGFIGTSLAQELVDHDHDVTIISRTKPPIIPEKSSWCEVNATSARQFQTFGSNRTFEGVVLVHGPSDITRCETEQLVALETHTGVVDNVRRFLPSAYILLVSTDNVFPGSRKSYNELDSPQPINAYGKAKLAAERNLERHSPDSLIARTSLVYGWEPFQRAWTNFFMLCLRSWSEGRKIAAPKMLWNTPIAVNHVSAIYRHCLEEKITGYLHVSGPEMLNRFQWACQLADIFNIEPDRIEPVETRDSRYFCRPKRSCLTSIYLDDLLGKWSDINVQSPGEFAHSFKETLPSLGLTFK